jgi:hypothetical protein
MSGDVQDRPNRNSMTNNAVTTTNINSNVFRTIIILHGIYIYIHHGLC